jgi:hypothetical protein
MIHVVQRFIQYGSTAKLDVVAHFNLCSATDDFSGCPGVPHILLASVLNALFGLSAKSTLRSW